VFGINIENFDIFKVLNFGIAKNIPNHLRNFVFPESIKKLERFGRKFITDDYDDYQRKLPLAVLEARANVTFLTGILILTEYT
jgi:hypothetical protein